jgi:predicted nucleic acid-binding protein
MIGKVCVDSNVLIYTLDPTKTTKAAACEAWLNQLALTGQIALSPQAISETINVLIKRGLKSDEIARLVTPFFPFISHPIDQAVIHGALGIFARYKTSWWDALMLGWAAQAGCGALLTEDSQSTSVIEGVQIVSPFAMEPQQFLGSSA